MLIGGLPGERAHCAGLDAWPCWQGQGGQRLIYVRKFTWPHLPIMSMASISREERRYRRPRSVCCCFSLAPSPGAACQSPEPLHVRTCLYVLGCPVRPSQARGKQTLRQVASPRPGRACLSSPSTYLHDVATPSFPRQMGPGVTTPGEARLAPRLAARFSWPNGFPLQATIC